VKLRGSMVKKEENIYTNLERVMEVFAIGNGDEDKPLKSSSKVKEKGN